MTDNLDHLFEPVEDPGSNTALDRLFAPEEEPHNVDAEAYLLCSLMHQNDGFYQVGDVLEPEYFYDPALGDLYGAMRKMVFAGEVANPVSLSRVDKEYGNAAIDALKRTDLVSTVNNRQYAQIIINMWQRREMIRIGRMMGDEARLGNMIEDPAAIREEAEAALFALADGAQSKGGAVPLSEFSESCVQAINEGITAYEKGEVTGVPSGLKKLDDLLTGFKRSHLIVLAGRPSMGKTALSLSLAYHAASHQDGSQKGAVAFFSLEMSRDELFGRLIANVADLDYAAVNKCSLNHADFRKVVEAEDRLKRLPLFIDHRPAATISRIRTECRKIARKAGGLKLIVIDYLQLMSGGGIYRPGDRYSLITDLTMQLKQLAKELDVPVIVLSQLSRAVEQRDDKRPQLADLRESGSIEQDADVVMFVYREEYYLERSEPVRKANEASDKFAERYDQWAMRMEEVRGTSDIIVGKARGARVGSARCSFLGHRQRFANLERVA